MSQSMKGEELTRTQLLEAKRDLERDLGAMLDAFTARTGLQVDEIGLNNAFNYVGMTPRNYVVGVTIKL